MIKNSTKLNKEKFSGTGNRIFLHSFENFSTTSTKMSIRIYISRALFLIAISMVIFYCLYVVLIVLNVTNKKQSISSLKEINHNISKVEKEYNNVISSINKENIASRGFLDVNNLYFVSKKDEVITFSFKNK